MNEIILDFAVTFFHKLNLVTNIIDMDTPLPNDLDLGLRRSIMGEKSKSLSENGFLPPTFTKEKTIYLSEDKYNCHYIFFPLAYDKCDKALVAGPYLIENTSIVRSNELCKKLGLAEGLYRFVHQYLATLPCLHDTSLVENFIDTIAEKIYGVGQYRIEYIRQAPDTQTIYKSEVDTTDNDDIMQRMEYRYNLEKKVINAISRGDFNAAMRASTDQALRNIDNRASNTLRSKKNNLLAFNTICRKGAEYGYVHPIYLDEMSRQMAIKIENMVSIEQDVTIHREILKNYCNMVQQNSTRGFSPTMQRALIHISQHQYDTDLTLQSTAESLNLNKTYLANLFKKETGGTFTAYVNGKRINHAIFLLNSTTAPIQEIASACGIPDVTYFTRLFKQEKGITPSEYRKMISDT